MAVLPQLCCCLQYYCGSVVVIMHACVWCLAPLQKGPLVHVTSHGGSEVGCCWLGAAGKLPAI